MGAWLHACAGPLLWARRTISSGLGPENGLRWRSSGLLMNGSVNVSLARRSATCNGCDASNDAPPALGASWPKMVFAKTEGRASSSDFGTGGGGSFSSRFGSGSRIGLAARFCRSGNVGFGLSRAMLESAVVISLSFSFFALRRSNIATDLPPSVSCDVACFSCSFCFRNAANLASLDEPPRRPPRGYMGLCKRFASRETGTLPQGISLKNSAAEEKLLEQVCETGIG